MTKQELFMQQAPSFNFEKNADELWDLAIERGVIVEGDNGEYDYSEEWLNKEA